MSGWKNLCRLLPIVALAMFVLTGCGDPYLSALDPKGPVAESQLSLIKLSFYIMLGVFIVVMVIFTYVLVKFRKRPGQTGIPKQVEGNHKLEIIWTTIPIILLLVLAIPTVITTFDLAEKFPSEDVVNVKVTAHQFWWEFDYPDLEVSTGQDLYIPTGKKVQFQLTSADVIHSFWVPALAGKTDTNPGMVNHMWFQADQPGVYQGKCAELCGPSHALMDFKVVAVSPEEFDTWVGKMKAAAERTPATATAQQGQEIFNKSCLGCHAVGGQGGKMGPNLTAFGDRDKVAGILEYNKENIAAWIHDPQSKKPGNLMPAFGDKLSDQEIDSLVEYLDGLKINE
ncbi:cytochrome c oxidase subunit II [Ammoniphilus resinae]|uniref:Cytochrome c oxidase subunit 2 n=1 Tax=Ammoniphilus resinae TaxID=861532 RepID=A0ABS4GRI2_9BACL|nr:cytochrome c oxidase subunit II [Ammoniphilus resinae]MBP1932632.1 cytochrome c oxidase subunit 2 [Ammoniphilus resinae]